MGLNYSAPNLEPYFAKTSAQISANVTTLFISILYALMFNYFVFKSFQ